MQSLRRRPLPAALLVLGAYAATFLVSQSIDSVLFAGELTLPAEGNLLPGEPSSGAFFIAQLPYQLATMAGLAIAISLLGWWGNVGLARPHRPVYLVPPFLLVALMAIGPFVLLQDVEGANSLLDIVTPRALALIALVFLVVSVTEELMFRGILLYGLRARLPVEVAVITGGIIFGLFHFINLLAGQSLPLTVSQVINVTSSGILYGALVVCLRSIIPVIILHAAWNFSLACIVLVMESEGMAGAVSGTPEQSLSILWPFVIGESLYALFILWRSGQEQVPDPAPSSTPL